MHSFSNVRVRGSDFIPENANNDSDTITPAHQEHSSIISTSPKHKVLKKLSPTHESFSPKLESSPKREYSSPQRANNRESTSTNLSFMSYYFSSSVSNLRPVSKQKDYYESPEVSGRRGSGRDAASGAGRRDSDGPSDRLLPLDTSFEETLKTAHPTRKMNKSMPNLLDASVEYNNSDEKISDPYGVYSPLEYAKLRRQVVEKDSDRDTRLSELRQV